jgi:hypothetical protein
LMHVRVMERRLALCWRRFSDWIARFFADLMLAKVKLLNKFMSKLRLRIIQFLNTAVNKIDG